MEWWDKAKGWLQGLLGKEPLSSPELLQKLRVGLPANGHVVAFGHFNSDRTYTRRGRVVSRAAV